MPDIVQETDAIYSLIKKYYGLFGSIYYGIELIKECKPHLAELKKVCPWPFGKSYEVPCNSVIDTSFVLIKDHFSFAEETMDINQPNWQLAFFENGLLISQIVQSQVLMSVDLCFKSIYLFESSKRKVENLLQLFTLKQFNLLQTYLSIKSML